MHEAKTTASLAQLSCNCRVILTVEQLVIQVAKLDYCMHLASGCGTLICRKLDEDSGVSHFLTCAGQTVLRLSVGECPITFPIPELLPTLAFHNFFLMLGAAGFSLLPDVT